MNKMQIFAKALLEQIEVARVRQLSGLRESYSAKHSDTARAISIFQKFVELDQTGQPDPRTMKLIKMVAENNALGEEKVWDRVYRKMTTPTPAPAAPAPGAPPAGSVQAASQATPGVNNGGAKANDDAGAPGALDAAIDTNLTNMARDAGDNAEKAAAWNDKHNAAEKLQAQQLGTATPAGPVQAAAQPTPQVTPASALAAARAPATSLTASGNEHNPEAELDPAIAASRKQFPEQPPIPAFMPGDTTSTSANPPTPRPPPGPPAAGGPPYPEPKDGIRPRGSKWNPQTGQWDYTPLVPAPAPNQSTDTAAALKGQSFKDASKAANAAAATIANNSEYEVAQSQGKDPNNPAPDPAPAPAPAGSADGAVGQELARMGVSKQNRLDQKFVDQTLGAGKFKAGSAQANMALQAHFKKNGARYGAAAPATAQTAPQTKPGTGASGFPTTPAPGITGSAALNPANGSAATTIPSGQAAGGPGTQPLPSKPMQSGSLPPPKASAVREDAELTAMLRIAGLR
jgi:hypothetical protein